MGKNDKKNSIHFPTRTVHNILGIVLGITYAAVVAAAPQVTGVMG